MAYATLMEFDVDLDTHIKIGEAVGDAPIKGLILHAGGPSERGVHSLDVWESKEDSERFFAERMVPALQQLGIPPGPPLNFQEFELPYVLGDSCARPAAQLSAAGQNRGIVGERCLLGGVDAPAAESVRRRRRRR